jgi:hypothetical protein
MGLTGEFSIFRIADGAARHDRHGRWRGYRQGDHVAQASPTGISLPGSSLPKTRLPKARLPRRRQGAGGDEAGDGGGAGGAQIAADPLHPGRTQPVLPAIAIAARRPAALAAMHPAAPPAMDRGGTARRPRAGARTTARRLRQDRRLHRTPLPAQDAGPAPCGAPPAPGVPSRKLRRVAQSERASASSAERQLACAFSASRI